MEKIEEPRAMREIHEIRRRIYEETKNMTSQEHIAYIKKKAKKFEAESGLRLRKALKGVKLEIM